MIIPFNLFSENDELKETRLTVKGEGDFALYSITSRMIGTAYIENPEYPDLFMLGDERYGSICYRYILDKYNDEGVPVFEKKEQVSLPEKSLTNCVIVQREGDIFLFWTTENLLECARYNIKESAFKKFDSVILPMLDYPIRQITIDILDNGSVKVICACTTKNSSRVQKSSRTADYYPYDGVGRWMGTFGYVGFYSFEYPDFLKGLPSKPLQVSHKKEEVLTSASAITTIKYSSEYKGIISGSFHGGIYFLNWKDENKFEVKRHIVDIHGNVIRHPTIGAAPIIYPNEVGENVNIIATGEGGAFFYRFVGKFTQQGQPIYETPVPLREKNPFLYGGSLCTPTLVDWDYDGTLDIVSGNSAGHILFFKNIGTNLVPSFRSGEYIKANGETIHIQPGYGENIQGPGESRWGYVGANVFDWNNDGLWDILINDSRRRHTVFMGDKKGSLSAGKPIFVDDLNLHGTHRCRPGVGVLGNDYVYITLDNDDDVHLYYREDDNNLIDGGKLRLVDGKNINANWLEAGGKGRVRFEITDWDGDGIKDLLLSTNLHNSIPNPDNGIPWNNPKELRGATLLFLKNVGSEENPIFEYPKQIKYKDVYVRFGHHGCGASTGMLGPISNNLPNVVVGDEKGSFYLLTREHLTW